jgi:hypothetical protein
MGSNRSGGGQAASGIDFGIDSVEALSLAFSKYPLTCPFSVEQILDEDFYGYL